MTQQPKPTRRAAVILALALSSIAVLLAPAAAPAAKPKFEVYTSCADGKPFKPAKHCDFDRRDYSRTTFVFESNVGKRVVKVCQKIYGLPVHGGDNCAVLGYIAQKNLPYVISGITHRFTAVLTWYAKDPGHGGFKRVAQAAVHVTP